MPINYLLDSNGFTIAVQIPIQDWKRMKDKYPDIDELDGSLPDWQRQLIDQRLEAIEKNPERLKTMDGLLQDIDKESS